MTAALASQSVPALDDGSIVTKLSPKLESVDDVGISSLKAPFGEQEELLKGLSPSTWREILEEKVKTSQNKSERLLLRLMKEILDTVSPGNLSSVSRSLRSRNCDFIKAAEVFRPETLLWSTLLSWCSDSR